jgi:hypothetical protein
VLQPKRASVNLEVLLSLLWSSCSASSPYHPSFAVTRHEIKVARHYHKYLQGSLPAAPLAAHLPSQVGHTWP